MDQTLDMKVDREFTFLLSDDEEKLETQSFV